MMLPDRECYRSLTQHSKPPNANESSVNLARRPDTRQPPNKRCAGIGTILPGSSFKQVTKRL